MRHVVFLKFIRATPMFSVGSFLGAVFLMGCFWFFQSKQLIWFTADSGAYLLNSFELVVPGDRTIFYSCFLLIVRSVFGGIGCNSLLPVVFIPLWLVVYLLTKILFLLHPSKKSRFTFWVSIISALLGIWFSGALWIFLQVMPDAFTSITFLSLFLSFYLFLKGYKSEAWKWGIVSVLAAVMHNGNLIPYTGTLLLILLFKLTNIKLLYKIRYVKILSFIFLPWIVVLVSNIIGGNGPTVSKNAPVFLVAKFSENGLLKMYLDQNCESNVNPLCAYKNNLPEHAWDFIWPEDGIHMKVGGWYKTDSLYRSIITDVATNSKTLPRLIYVSLRDSWRQLLLWGVGDGLIHYNENSTILKIIKDHYPKTGVGKTNDFSKYNSIIRRLLLLVVLLFLVICIRKFNALNRAKWFMSFFSMFVGFCFLQAFSTGALANVLMRLNMRAVWVFLPIMLSIVLRELVLVINQKSAWNSGNKC